MDMNTDIDPTDEIGCEEAPGFQDAEDAFDTYVAITTMRSEAARLRRERLEEDALAYFNPSATL